MQCSTRSKDDMDVDVNGWMLPMSKKEIFASGAMPSISPKTPKLFPATEPDTWVPCPSEVGAREGDSERERERESE
jgi:hypothetical protein